MKIPEFTATLFHKETVAKDTILLRLTMPDDVSFESGQFISILVAEKAWRAYSIASAPFEAYLELVVRLIPNGKGSEFLKKAEIGQDMTVRGPFGHFLLNKSAEKHVFCGTGTGIAPFRSMLLTLAQDEALKNAKTELWYGGRDENDIAYLENIALWHADVKICLGLSQNASLTKHMGGNVEVFNKRITHFVDNIDVDANTTFYLCGNGDMVRSMREALLEKGVGKQNIRQERFN